MQNKVSKNRRKTRISSSVHGTSEKPRLCVFRSNKTIYVQLVDDINGKTLLALSGKHLEKQSGSKVDKAKALGIALAAKAIEKKLTKVIFDKGSYRYHGRVKAIADGAREGGLQF